MGKTLIDRGNDIKNLNEELQRIRDQHQQDMGRSREEFNVEHTELERVRQALTQAQENIRNLRETIVRHDQLETCNQELLQNIRINTSQIEVLQRRTEDVIEAEVRQEIQNRGFHNAIELARHLADRVRINTEVNGRLADRDRQIHDLEVEIQAWQEEVVRIQNSRVDLQNCIRDLNQTIDFMSRRQIILSDIINVANNRRGANQVAQNRLTIIEADFQERINALNERIEQLQREHT